VEASRAVWLVCGGRDYNNAHAFDCRMDRLVYDLGCPDIVIHGGYRGADKLADGWARGRHIHVAEVQALWGATSRPAAGPARNSAMLLLQPTLVVAMPGGRGTADMERKARYAGIRVISWNS
jgi:hypothetical protein